VTGRGVFAPPGETMKTLPPAANRANMAATFDGNGNLVPTVPITSGSLTAGPNISLTGSNPTTIDIKPGTANTFKGTLNGSTTSDIALTACTLTYQITKWVAGTGWQCGFNPVLPSRAIAATLNLAAFSTITTQGYTTAGDGGGATYKNARSSPFVDSYIAGATRVGGSGYVNNGYLGVSLSGGTGHYCNVGATVSGNAVTAVSNVMPCVGYSVGDVLTANNSFLGGSGSGFTWTVTSLSTPQGSFTDSGGLHWQYVENGGFTNALQFGCKPDWNGTDSGATNNSPCLWGAFAWAGAINGTAISAGGYGGHVIIPKGAYMTCGAFNNTSFNFNIPQSVRVSGASIFGTVLIECAADNGATHYMGLCDPNAPAGEFGCKIEHINLYGFQVAAASAGTAMIYSNSGQQFALAEDVEVDADLRGCVRYETGLGGAANDIWIGIDCIQSGSATSSNPGYFFNASGTQHILEHSVCASGPAGAAICIQHGGGRLIASGIDIEGFVIGLQMNNAISGNISSYKNVQEQSGSCSEAIQLASGNVPGNILFENIATGCPITIQNGQSGGTNFTGNIVKQITCVSGACN
jgi:hypothetical protein